MVMAYSPLGQGPILRKPALGKVAEKHGVRSGRGGAGLGAAAAGRDRHPQGGEARARARQHEGAGGEAGRRRLEGAGRRLPAAQARHAAGYDVSDGICVELCGKLLLMTRTEAIAKINATLAQLSDERVQTLAEIVESLNSEPDRLAEDDATRAAIAEGIAQARQTFPSLAVIVPSCTHVRLACPAIPTPSTTASRAARYGSSTFVMTDESRSSPAISEAVAVSATPQPPCGPRRGSAARSPPPASRGTPARPATSAAATVRSALGRARTPGWRWGSP